MFAQTTTCATSISQHPTFSLLCVFLVLRHGKKNNAALRSLGATKNQPAAKTQTEQRLVEERKNNIS